MPCYTVTFSVRGKVAITVEAENRDGAETLAELRFNAGADDTDLSIMDIFDVKEVTP